MIFYGFQALKGQRVISNGRISLLCGVLDSDEGV